MELFHGFWCRSSSSGVSQISAGIHQSHLLPAGNCPCPCSQPGCPCPSSSATPGIGDTGHEHRDKGTPGPKDIGTLGTLWFRERGPPDPGTWGQPVQVTLGTRGGSLIPWESLLQHLDHLPPLPFLSLFTKNRKKNNFGTKTRKNNRLMFNSLILELLNVPFFSIENLPRCSSFSFCHWINPCGTTGLGRVG